MVDQLDFDGLFIWSVTDGLSKVNKSLFTSPQEKPNNTINGKSIPQTFLGVGLQDRASQCSPGTDP